MIHNQRLLYATTLLLPLTAWALTPKAPVIVQVPVTGRAQMPDGSTITLNGVLNAQLDAVQPPDPDPLAISSLTVQPQTVFQGAGTTGTVTLSRSPGQSVQIAISAVDTRSPLTLPTSVTIQPGQTSGTFAIGTADAPNADFWYTVSASLNGQSKAASLLVRANATPPPPPPPPTVPTVTGYLDTSGVRPLFPVPGQVLVIEGRGFGTERGEVLWQEQAATVTEWTDTRITVTLPTLDLGGLSHWFQVRRPDGATYQGMVPR